VNEEREREREREREIIVDLQEKKEEGLCNDIF
jgi:hypothetical protein